jgi:hypothetical protein
MQMTATVRATLDETRILADVRVFRVAAASASPPPAGSLNLRRALGSLEPLRHAPL